MAVPDVDVVMSWRPGCPYRERNLLTVLDHYAQLDLNVVLHGAEDGVGWNRAHDVTPMVEQSTASVIVVADADVVCRGTAEAIDKVRAGAAWAVPHLMLCRLTDDASERVVAGEAPEMQDGFAERPYKGHPGGTLFVIQRDVYLDCPLDPRFQNWGQEDDAACLAWTLLHGRPWRGEAACYHLWHPPQPRRSRGIGNDSNLALYKTYRAARNDSARMRAIVDQAKAVA